MKASTSLTHPNLKTTAVHPHHQVGALLRDKKREAQQTCHSIVDAMIDRPAQEPTLMQLVMSQNRDTGLVLIPPLGSS